MDIGPPFDDIAVERHEGLDTIQQRQCLILQSKPDVGLDGIGNTGTIKRIHFDHFINHFHRLAWIALRVVRNIKPVTCVDQVGVDRKCLLQRFDGLHLFTNPGVVIQPKAGPGLSQFGIQLQRLVQVQFGLRFGLLLWNDAIAVVAQQQRGDGPLRIRRCVFSIQGDGFIQQRKCGFYAQPGPFINALPGQQVQIVGL